MAPDRPRRGRVGEGNRPQRGGCVPPIPSRAIQRTGRLDQWLAAACAFGEWSIVVSVLAGTEQTSPVALEPDATGDPPSLRRRAPARIDIILKSGKPLKMTRRKVHVPAGSPFALQVVPQNPSAKVEIAAELPVHTIVPASRIVGGRTPTYHAEFSGRLHLRMIPLPTTGKLYVIVIDGLPAPSCVTIDVAVWPLKSTLLFWWLLVFLSIVGLRWKRLVADSDSVPDLETLTKPTSW